MKGIAALSASTLAAPPNRPFAMERSANIGDPPFTAAGLAAAIKAGDLSAQDVAEIVVDRVNGAQNLEAFITFDEDRLMHSAKTADEIQARGATLGPLHGVPIALKDNIEAVGYPNTGGTPALKDHRPQQNATVTQRLVDAGAIIAGKVNMDELAGGGTTNNPTFGRTRNPYNMDHVPGGSSGGGWAPGAGSVGDRHSWLHPHPGRLLWHRWTAAHTEPRSQ